jgi:hypothetical protein
MRIMRREQASQEPVVIRTLGDLGERNELYAYCDACRHSRQLDLAALRDRYGPQLSLKRLQGSTALFALRRARGADFHVWDAGPNARA